MRIDRFFYKLEKFLKRQMTRGAFLKICCGGLLFLISENSFLRLAFARTGESGPRPKRGIKGVHDLVVSQGADPYSNTIKAVEAMGGMALFVKEGDTVLVKPNIAWDRTPEQAANTNPQVVAALVELCYQAGAKRVNVFDVPCNDDRRTYENSGIQKAAEEKGAKVYFADHWNVVKAKFPYPSPMEDWPIMRDAMVCDKLINVPILKHHSIARLTIAMKNLMGVCSGTRGKMHVDIGRKLVDLTDYIYPELTVIDATRVLLRNGPIGGNLEDVERMDKVIVGTDPVLADSYAAGLMNVDLDSVPYLKEARERGFGQTDVSQADIHEVKS